MPGQKLDQPGPLFKKLEEGVVEEEKNEIRKIIYSSGSNELLLYICEASKTLVRVSASQRRSHTHIIQETGGQLLF